MASRGAIAGIDAEARKRISVVEEILARKLSVEVPPEPPFARQPELRAAYDLERHAGFLEAVAMALPPMEVETDG